MALIAYDEPLLRMTLSRLYDLTRSDRRQ